MNLLRQLLIAPLTLLCSATFALALCEAEDMIDMLPADERAALLTLATETSYGEGLLWQATRGGTVITLFGTYHFRHAQTENHLAQLKPFIDAASSVYLEMSDSDQNELQTALANDPSLMFILEGPTLPDLLGEEDWSKLREEMHERQIPGVIAAKFKPLWAMMMLSIGPCEAQNGATSQHGIDVLVSDYAESSGIPTKSLEDFIEIFSILDSEPLEKQIDMIRLSLNYPGDADDMFFTIRERYLKEQIALTWEFTRLVSLEFGGTDAEQDFTWLEDTMLTKRNRNWVEILVSQTEGQTVLVAVGAGHLPGENGVLRLLEERGFAIERLAVARPE